MLSVKKKLRLFREKLQVLEICKILDIDVIIYTVG